MPNYFHIDKHIALLYKDGLKHQKRMPNEGTWRKTPNKDYYQFLDTSFKERVRGGGNTSGTQHQGGQRI